jgi:biotin operon repressor
MDVAEPLDRTPDPEGWVDSTGGWFEEAYRYLRHDVGLRPRAAFIGAWLSCAKDDRGTLTTYGQLADFLGVSRTAIYANIARNKLRDWAEQLRLARLRGEGLAEVDRITYTQAVDPESPVAARRLYYERAGVLKNPPSAAEIDQGRRLQDWLDELRAESDE